MSADCLILFTGDSQSVRSEFCVRLNGLQCHHFIQLSNWDRINTAHYTSVDVRPNAEKGEYLSTFPTH